MPGIDYQQVKQLIGMGDVLDLLQWNPLVRRGAEERGACPIHGSKSPGSRSFAVNRMGNKFQCFSCGAKGNHLDLFAGVVKRDLYTATIELCRRLQVDVPYLTKYDQRRGASTGLCRGLPSQVKGNAIALPQDETAQSENGKEETCTWRV